MRQRRALVALAVLVATTLVGPRPVRSEGGTVDDDHLPPWGDEALALPPWVKSAHVLLADEAIYEEPREGARRHGSAGRETLLPLFGQAFGSGCDGAWLHVGARAWLCGRNVELSGATPVAPRSLTLPPGPDGLPLRYFFVNQDGGFAYDRIEDVDVGEPAMQLDPGFAVAIVDEQLLGGEVYARTNRGLWLNMRDVHPANPLIFEGAALDATPSDTIPVAWVVSERAPIYAGTGFAPSGKSLPRFSRVAWLGESRGHARIGDDTWVATRDVRHPTVAPPPPEVLVDAGERWIDIELATQTLVAYEGTRPVFATIVSTGKGPQGSGNATPKGTFRIWIKLLTSVMDNLEDEDANRYYRMEDVPYVQYFSKGVGLHAAYWHRSFGHVRSHGCVNLSPLDAARLFGFTLPRMPGGWTAVLPTEVDRATVVRVR